MLKLDINKVLRAVENAREVNNVCIIVYVLCTTKYKLLKKYLCGIVCYWRIKLNIYYH